MQKSDSYGIQSCACGILSVLMDMLGLYDTSSIQLCMPTVLFSDVTDVGLKVKHRISTIKFFCFVLIVV